MAASNLKTPALPGPVGRALLSSRVLRSSRALPSALTLALVLVLVLAASHAMAAVQPAQQPILLEAQSTEVDLRTDNMVFRKVRISQGTMSISAEQGQATKQAVPLAFDNNIWVFRGNVKIATDQGQLTSDQADITFTKKLLSKAVVNGSPAKFEQRIEKTGKLAQGHADNIDYDVAKGVVHLSQNAWLSDGQREIQGESLKYNVLTQTIIAEASEQGSQRVHIIITPPANSKP